MRYFYASMFVTFVFGASAFAGKMVAIVKTEITPLCHVLPHHAAPSFLQRAITAAEEESKNQCGRDAKFSSDSVSIETIQDGCGELVVEVRGTCFRP